MGPLWVPVRRFDVRQGEKLRLPDDSEYGLNATVTSPEKVDLWGGG